MKLLNSFPEFNSKEIDFSRLKFDDKIGKAVFNFNGGFDVKDIVKALREKPELMEYFQKTGDYNDKFLVYNDAYFNDGFFVKIDKSGEFNLDVNSDKKAVIRNLIIVEENIEAKVFVRVSGKGEINLVNIIFVKENGSCKFGFLQCSEGVVVVFNKGVVNDNGKLDVYSANFGFGLKKCCNENYLLGQKSCGNIFDIFFCNKSEMDINSRVYCKNSDNKSFLLAKGMAKNKGTVCFEGYSKIDKNVRNIDLFVKEQGVVLDKDSRIHLIPNLEIESNDVKAGHAASVELFDEEKLFYMQSRGLSEEESKRLLIEGFFLSILDKVEILEMRNEILNFIKIKK